MKINPKIWIAIRFIVFGVGGFWMMMYFALVSIDRVVLRGVSPSRVGMWVNLPLWVSVPLMIVGASLMLFAAGELGRWRYISVFLSIPATFLLLVLLPQSITDQVGTAGLTASVAIVPWLVYLLSRRTYRSRGTPKA